VKRWLLAAGAVVLVLGLGIGGLWIFSTTPVEPVAEKHTPVPCDSASREVLTAVHAPEPGVGYVDIKCEQNRYTLGILNTPDRGANDMPVLFEFKDNAWKFVASQTDMPCGQVPKEVWKAWNFPCLKEPVVCRAGESKVTDLSGDVGCPAALDIAERYRAAIENQQAQGQGLFWESGEWSCSWPYEDGLAHVQVPQKCVRTTDDLVVQLGDYQR
jgi:hypothetical protein